MKGGGRLQKKMFLFTKPAEEMMSCTEGRVFVHKRGEMTMGMGEVEEFCICPFLCIFALTTKLKLIWTIR